MISGIVAGQQAAASPSAANRVIFPLTYDELDATDSVALVRSGGYGPHVTPDGFEGDGYGARYVSPNLPAWASGGALTLAASVTSPVTRLSSTREVLVTACATGASATPRLELATVADPRSGVAGAIAVRSGTNQQIIGRPGWRYDFRSPVLSEGGLIAKPQGILFLDADTVIFSIHLDDTESRVYKIRLSDSAVLGEFTFGATHRHVASFAWRSNGEVWAGDYDTLSALRLDLDESFSTGIAQITHTYSCAALAGFSAIEFVTIGGVEYFLLGQYATSDTDTYIRLVDASKLSGTAFVLGDQYRSYLIGRRVQGIAMRGDQLIVARNSLYGGIGTISGYIQAFNLPGMVGALANNAAVHATANAQFITGQWDGPSSYLEDVAVHPITGDVYTPTEGAYAVADFPGYAALWSSSLNLAGVRNDYHLSYDGAGSVMVLINGREWGALTWTPPASAADLCIGGLPLATAGFASGFTWATVANVLLQDRPLTSSEAIDLAEGVFEPQTLTVYPVTLVNPGAESGTSGWTDEVGGLAIRTAAPPPFEGAQYFTGGSHVQTISRQRVDLAAQGVPVGTFEPGLAWAKIRWMQSAYSDQDPGGMGIRQLTAADAAISTQYSGLAWVLGGGGAAGPWYWYPRVLSVSIDSETRKVDAIYNASGRTMGTANDHYVDRITMQIYAP